MVNRVRMLGAVAALIHMTGVACAQPPGGMQRPPAFASPEVKADRTVVFRVHAPQAQSVPLTGGDMPGIGPGKAMTKGENGVWEATMGPLAPGAYRYLFNVDGLSAADPRNPSTSESVGSVWSLVRVPGSDLMDMRDVPHGAVAEVVYQSSSLKRMRRMHVYTPPGYESSTDRYPVFYLLHGAGDSDDSWTTVGQAGAILDNLIASGKAKPMLVVMPSGHTRPFEGFGRGLPSADEFVADFVGDIMPQAERRYRTIAEPSARAIAGLSMGGSQTLNVATPHLARFGYVGVFSSGLFGIVPMGPGGGDRTKPFPWEEQHKSELDDAKAREGLKLLWFATGKDDFLVQTTRATVDLFKEHGFRPVYNETDGAHTWLKWRDYLIEFAPMLFR